MKELSQTCSDAIEMAADEWERKNRQSVPDEQSEAMLNVSYYNGAADALRTPEIYEKAGLSSVEWIPVSNPPEIGEYVLIGLDTEMVFKGRLMNNGWTALYADGEHLVRLDQVIGWMPLPKIRKPQ